MITELFLLLKNTVLTLRQTKTLSTSNQNCLIWSFIFVCDLTLLADSSLGVKKCACLCLFLIIAFKERFLVTGNITLKVVMPLVSKFFKQILESLFKKSRYESEHPAPSISIFFQSSPSFITVVVRTYGMERHSCLYTIFLCHFNI